MLLRPSIDRGRSRLDWLDSRHTFSFAQYYDPEHVSFGPLRVINEDFIAPEGGFGTHPHRDMEIITYVIEGALTHRDSLGTGSTISSGEIQKMSAGTGILHSEFNASKEQPVHLLQIWISPDQKGLKPSYEQERYTLQPGEWTLLAGPDKEALVSLRQEARLFATRLGAGKSVTFRPRQGKNVWIQLVKGSGLVGQTKVSAGDGLSALSGECQQIEIVADEDTELLLFEVEPD